MKHLHLDLAPASWRRQLHRMHRAARLLSVAALLLCVVAGFHAHTLLARLDSLDSEGARAEQSAHPPPAVANAPIDPKQGAAVNAAVARLNLPWSDILNAVEAATPPQVALLSIAPEPGRELLRIEAESSSSKDMIEYLKTLELQPSFGHVDLVKHELAKDGMDGVTRFQIEAQWRGTGS